ncbi:hypothetical protein ABW19_dt0209501 [Dactylella cylindrospora]|nr:hypothetical protein ABW19_dt0209501 [Dactylella cylindrospora]
METIESPTSAGSSPPASGTSSSFKGSNDSSKPVKPIYKRKRRNVRLEPYTKPTINVYSASSSLLTINGHPVSPTHKIPAAADEILFHVYKHPKWHMPDEVDMIMRDDNRTKEYPDSDLLKAVHAYTADFFRAKGWEAVGTRMLDEEALVAVGLLLEEWCREAVGKQGDLVFLEKEGD